MTHTRHRDYVSRHYGGAGAGQDHADEMMALDADEVDQALAGGSAARLEPLEARKPNWLMDNWTALVWAAIVATLMLLGRLAVSP